MLASTIIIIIVYLYFVMYKSYILITIINHTLPSTIRAVIGTLTSTSMASISTNSNVYTDFAKL